MHLFLDEIKRMYLHESSYWVTRNSSESVYLKVSNILGSEYQAVSKWTINSLLDKVDDTSIKVALNSSKTYETVYSNTIYDPYAQADFTITEMLYCDQIELYENEFVMLQQHVYIKHLARVLFRGQFVKVPASHGQGPGMRICLHDSGFTYISSSSPENGMDSLRMLQLLVFCFILLL